MPATYSYRQIWHIAYPVLIGTLMEQLIGLTDTAFLGRVGEVELGAAAIGGIAHPHLCETYYLLTQHATASNFQ